VASALASVASAALASAALAPVAWRMSGTSTSALDDVDSAAAFTTTAPVAHITRWTAGHTPALTEWEADPEVANAQLSQPSRAHPVNRRTAERQAPGEPPSHWSSDLKLPPIRTVTKRRWLPARAPSIGFTDIVLDAAAPVSSDSGCRLQRVSDSKI
jgi:hypothetical protein